MKRSGVRQYKYSKAMKDAKPLRLRHTLALSPSRHVTKIYDAKGQLIATMDPVTRQRIPVKKKKKTSGGSV